MSNSDNVIEASDQFRRGSQRDRSDPRANEERLRNIEQKRLEEVRKGLRQTPLPRFDKRDRLHAAIALRELKQKLARGHLADVEKKLAEEFGWGDGHKVHRFIAPEDDLSDGKKATALAVKLTAKIEKYLDVAKAIAAVAECDEDDAQDRVLRNTTFWQKRSLSAAQHNSPHEVDEAAEEVALLLQQLCARVIRETGLAKLFARMRRVPGQWDVRTGKFTSSEAPSLFQSAYQDWNQVWEKSPPLPSVALVRLLHATWSLPIRLNRQGSDCFPDPDTLVGPVTKEDGDEFNAHIRLYREIRLAVGPTVNSEMIGPLFESRASATIWANNTAGSLDPFGLLTDDRSVALQVGQKWYRVSRLAELTNDTADAMLAKDAAAGAGIHVDDPLYWDQTPLDENKRSIENYNLSWTAANAAYLAHWLDRMTGDQASHPVEFLPEAPVREPPRGTWFLPPLLGCLVESSINDGRLQLALVSEVERIRIAFKQHETQWRTCMHEQTAEQIAEFRSDLTAVHPTGTESKDIPDEPQN